jgi:hypothetical protein
MDKRRIAFAMRRGPRPKTQRCAWCTKKMGVQTRGRIPLFCSQSCRQRAYEKRRWSRPSVIEALAQDLATSEGRAIIRKEVLATLRGIPTHHGSHPAADSGAETPRAATHRMTQTSGWRAASHQIAPALVNRSPRSRRRSPPARIDHHHQPSADRAPAPSSTASSTTPTASPQGRQHAKNHRTTRQSRQS